MICFKLYAAVDHSGVRTSKHLTDLQALAPTVDELIAASRWTRTHDDSGGFRQELKAILARLGVEAGDADL